MFKFCLMLIGSWTMFAAQLECCNSTIYIIQLCCRPQAYFCFPVAWSMVVNVIFFMVFALRILWLICHGILFHCVCPSGLMNSVTRSRKGNFFGFYQSVTALDYGVIRLYLPFAWAVAFTDLRRHGLTSRQMMTWNDGLLIPTIRRDQSMENRTSFIYFSLFSWHSKKQGIRGESPMILAAVLLFNSLTHEQQRSVFEPS